MFYGNRYFVILNKYSVKVNFFTICQTTNITECFHQYRHGYMKDDVPFPKTETNVGRAEIAHLVRH